MTRHTLYKYVRARSVRGSLRQSRIVVGGLLLMAGVLVSCQDAIELAGESQTKVELAFDVSNQRAMTRMVEAATIGDGRDFLDLYLFPFSVEGKIGSHDSPLSDNVANLNWETVPYHRLGNRSVDIAIGTASFLCYAKAGNYPGDDPFVNGTLTSGLTNSSTPSGISFSPVLIHESVDITTDDKPSQIAAYLTAIANALKDARKDEAYQTLINEGRPVAASGKNVEQIAAWAQNQGITLPEGTYDSEYPGSSLPDGAAVVRWNHTESRFAPVTQTTTESNINSLNRFVYPPALYYFANSRIKTSQTSKKEFYDRSKWADVLKEYENDDAVTDNGARSVAIKDPLHYAVGCLEIRIKASHRLEDANGSLITLNNATFPLTGLLVSGQFEQAFDFTPDGSAGAEERIIYDPNVTGQSMGAASSTDETDELLDYTHTLVLQSRDQAAVRFALEFENNSGQDFQGLDGTVRQGTKFYLVGTIDVSRAATEDYKKRAFTKGYITQGTVKITSLRQAHTYLPDLLDARLEIGVKLTTNWIQSTTTNVPL